MTLFHTCINADSWNQITQANKTGYKPRENLTVLSELFDEGHPWWDSAGIVHIVLSKKAAQMILLVSLKQS